MYFVRTSLFLVALTLPALAQSTPSVNGDWKLHIDVSGNTADDNCKFTQDGDKVTGTCGTFTNISGKVEGDKVTIDMAGSEASLTLTGKLTDGKISGSVLVKEYSMDGVFEAIRSK